MRWPWLLAVLCLPPLPAEQIVWEVALPFRDAGRIRLADGLLLTGNITGRGGTTAFDAATGKLLWRVGGQQRGGPIPGPKAVFTTNHEMGASALDPKTGKPIWRAPEMVLASYIDMAYDGSNLYIAGFAGKLWALDAATGKLRWEHVHQPGDRAGACLSTPVIGEGILIYGGGAPDSITALLWGLDPATGREIWRTPAGCAKGLALSGGIVVMTSGGLMTGLDARTGKVLWRTPPVADNKWLSEPVIDGGRAYAIHENGLVGYNLTTGRQEFEFAGNFPNSDARRHLQIVSGKAYFVANFEQPRSEGNRSGFLYALDLASKEVLMRHRVNRDKRYSEKASTSHFRVDGEFIYYENESLLVKLRQ